MLVSVIELSRHFELSDESTRLLSAFASVFGRGQYNLARCREVA
jgi:hypothetical protein